MTEENKTRKKLTVSKLGASALKAGAQTTDDNNGQTTSHRFQDCMGGLDTYYNDTGAGPNGGKTISKK